MKLFIILVFACVLNPLFWFNTIHRKWRKPITYGSGSTPEFSLQMSFYDFPKAHILLLLVGLNQRKGFESRLQRPFPNLTFLNNSGSLCSLKSFNSSSVSSCSVSHSKFFNLDFQILMPQNLSVHRTKLSLFLLQQWRSLHD